MRLVLESELTQVQNAEEKPYWKRYKPLLVIIGMILLTTLELTIKDSISGSFALQKTISYFMIGFFLVFSGFKLLDLQGFAEGYATYDLIAKRLFAYGFLYPFIELFFAIAMLFAPFSKPLLCIEILVMSVSGIGVAKKLRRHERFQCACLGTFLKVPLTTVTVIEDFGMAALALLLLFF